MIGLMGCRSGKLVMDTGSTVEPGSIAVGDSDRDGTPADEDCDDDDPYVYPGAEEICDGIDNNCDGEVDEGLTQWVFTDEDRDGYGDPASAFSVCEPGEGQVQDGSDCDDADPEIHPDAEEICDGLDNDCDLEIDEGTDLMVWYYDADGDGYGDLEITITTCAGDPPEGYVAQGTDCDDTDSEVHPGAPERCDELDNDCNGSVDDGVTTIWFLDMDGDGAGDPGVALDSCDPSAGYVDNSLDCDDTHPGLSPWAAEACNGMDDDCDGAVDEDDALDAGTWYADGDADGFGDPDAAQSSCEMPSGYSEVAGDCDDANPAVNPDALEVCNGIDDDCDAFIDAVDPSVIDARIYSVDDDGDGYGSDTDTVLACDAPSGWVLDDSDCDDSDAAVNPEADEICNEIDDDCDGFIDAVDADILDAHIYALDDDGDGYGSEDSTVLACDPPFGWVLDDTDCNDSDAAVHPGAEEVCNGIDDDCDDRIDADDPGVTDATTYYIDHDDDGYGSVAYVELACEAPSGFVEDDTDCDDLDDEIYPGAVEVCDGVDGNCDGVVTWQEEDADGDGLLNCQEALWLETSRESNNDPTRSASHGSLEAAILLAEHGVTTTSATMYSVPLTTELLEQYGILVLYGLGYDGPLSVDEASLLEEWIYEGGRMLYVGGWGSSSSCSMTNSLPDELGISCAYAGYTWSGTASMSGSHPLDDDVSTIIGLGGELWSVSSPASTLANAGGWPFVVAVEHGEGRVVGLSDEWPLYNRGTSSSYDIGARDNEQLIDNIWAWTSEFEL
jgi:hypothetical protein